MPTTTNYGWTTPADTDLVKDGASAIRTLGTAIDTTTYNNAQAAIAKSIIDAKGDLIVGTAADTVARLAVGGTNGHVLQVDSSTASGLKWDAVAAGGQTLLNPGGTTLSGSSVTISSIPATYKDLKIVMINRTLNADGDYAFRFNGDSNANRYQSPIGGAKTFDSSYMLIGEYGKNTDVGSYHLSYCFDYALTTTYKMLMVQVQVVTDQNNAPSGFNWSRHAGIYSQLGAINSITVLPTSATSFTGGTIYVYGVS